MQVKCFLKFSAVLSILFIVSGCAAPNKVIYEYPEPIYKVRDAEIGLLIERPIYLIGKPEHQISKGR